MSPTTTEAEEIINDLQRVSILLSDSNPTAEQYRTHGNFTLDKIRTHFDRFNKAKREAGLECSTDAAVSDLTLIDAIYELYLELGHAPTEDEMDELGEFSSTTYQRRFDGWMEALRATAYVIEDFEYNATNHRPAPTAVA